MVHFTQHWDGYYKQSTQHSSHLSHQCNKYKLLLFLKGILQLSVCHTHNFCYQLPLKGFFRWIQVCSSAINISPPSSFSKHWQLLAPVITLVPHQYTRSAAQSPTWPRALPGSITDYQPLSSFLPSLSIAPHVSVSFYFSLAVYLSPLSNVFLSMKYPEFRAAVKLQKCNPVQVTSALQSITQPVPSLFTLPKQLTREPSACCHSPKPLQKST